MLAKLPMPAVMGILNITPDSFTDGGKYISLEKAVAYAYQMQKEGADIIDIGGESTRPGARSVSEQEEIDRVIPVIQILRQRLTIPISIDTSKARVMQLAIQAGANFINDVYALQQPEALVVAANLDVPVCLMHMRGNPQNMQKNPHYTDLLKEVIDFFEQRIEAALQAGIKHQNILLDPGFGFGKTVEHNLKLIQGLDIIKAHFGLPILIGISLKSTIGYLLNNAPVCDRLYGSLALELLALLKGADILRVHQVKPTKDCLTILKRYQEMA
jgi:dihydropteroate synthase